MDTGENPDEGDGVEPVYLKNEGTSDSKLSDTFGIPVILYFRQIIFFIEPVGVVTLALLLVEHFACSRTTIRRRLAVSKRTAKCQRH